MNFLDLLYVPVALVTAPWWAFKRRAGWRERFGHAQVPQFAPHTGPGTPVTSNATPRKRVLIHAVSVGEVAALRHLIPLLTPHVDVILSATTDTGLARAKALFGATCHIVRYPLDFSFAVGRFLDTINPDLVALVELEVWPNFVGACAKRAIPICIINGRLSERSFRGYSRIRSFFSATLAKLHLAAVQDSDYHERFIALGMPKERCLIAGSMKWDAARIEDGPLPGSEALASELGIDLTRPLIVAGSTGPGEEALLHASCPPGVQLLCAPRKTERFDQAAQALPGCIRRSMTSTAAPPAPATAVRPLRDRFLLDTIGELRLAYSLATVVIVGRSFGTQYGSDPIEPVGLGKATIIGPAVGDFSAIVAELVSKDGLIQTTREALPATLANLLGNPPRRAALAHNARACIRINQGASERQARMLLEIVGVNLDLHAPAAAESQPRTIGHPA